MTHPESPHTEMLRYVREEISTLRSVMHDELAAMRTDLTALAVEMRSQVPKVAVLEHRVTKLETYVELRVGQIEKSLEKAVDRRWALYVALIGAAIAIAGTILNIVTR